jgi:hypothetical protein
MTKDRRLEARHDGGTGIDAAQDDDAIHGRIDLRSRRRSFAAARLRLDGGIDICASADVTCALAT